MAIHDIFMDSPGTDADLAPPILVTTVDIGEGQSEQIELREGDSPEGVAAAFCAKHGLPDDVVAPLTDHISDHLARAMSGSPSGDGSRPESDLAGMFEDSPGGSAEDSLYSAARSSDGDYDSYGPHADNAAMYEQESAAESGSGFPPDYGKVDSGYAAALRRQQEAVAGEDWTAPPLPPAAARLAENLSYTAPGAPPSKHHPPLPPPQPREDGAEDTPWAKDGETFALHQGQGGGRERIFDRLYSHGRQREQRLEIERRMRDEAAATLQSSYKLAISSRSHELAAGRTANGEYRHHGERMYVEGVLDQRRKAQLAEEAAAARAAAELKEVTLAPQINVRSRSLPAGGGVLNRLTQTRTDKTQERLEALRREKEEAAVAGCTFKPAINRRSDRLMADRSTVLREHRISAHDQLFQDATRRAMRASEYEYWYPEEVTFQPAVNPQRPPPPGKQARPDADVPVQDRLYSVAKRTADKLEAKRRAELVDSATGQPLFKPATGRAPAHARNRAAAPVGDYLYSMRREHDAKKGVLNALSDQQRQAAATMPFTTQVSKTMVGKLKAKRFRQIFEYLDTSGTGALDLVTLVRALRHPRSGRHSVSQRA